MEDRSPSPAEPNGGDSRDGRGRFLPGNKAGKGNPFARRTQEIRAVLMEVCTPEAVKAAAERLMELAQAGDRFAFAELLNRTIGTPVASDLLERIEAIEAALFQRQATGDEPKGENREP